LDFRAQTLTKIPNDHHRSGVSSDPTITEKRICGSSYQNNGFIIRPPASVDGRLGIVALAIEPLVPVIKTTASATGSWHRLPNPSNWLPSHQMG